jgi:hypothetical protein
LGNVVIASGRFRLAGLGWPTLNAGSPLMSSRADEEDVGRVSPDQGVEHLLAEDSVGSSPGSRDKSPRSPFSPKHPGGGEGANENDT